MFLLILSLVSLNGVAREYWYSDPNVGIAGGVPADFYSRMERLKEWEKALREVDVYYFRRASARKVDDQSLRKLAEILNRFNIPVALDDGAATWAHGRYSRPDFSGSIKTIKRLKGLGFNIQYIGLQSVLSKLKRSMPKYQNLENMSRRYQDVTTYMEQLSEVFPGIQIGIIDALPAKLPIAKVKVIYSGLLQVLKDKQLKLAFIHMDVPMSYPRKRIKGNSWQNIVELSEFIKNELNTEVGLVLVSNIGGRKSGEKSLYYIKQGLKKYRELRIQPDMYIYNSWYPFPKYSVPDHSSETSFGIFRQIFEYLNRKSLPDEV